MQRKALLFTALLLGLSTLLYGQTLTVSPATLPDGMYGYAYGPQALTASGGTAPYTFAVSLGALPPGMSLSTDGTLSGTPTAIGVYLFTVTAQDNTPAPGTLSGTQLYTLTVDPAPLTITANNLNMTYGGTVPALTVSYTGFVNGDGSGSLTTQPVLTTTASSLSTPGTYPINFLLGAIDPNYTISYNVGTMTVGKAILTVTADNQTMPLGGPLPTLTISYSGFVNLDNASSLTTQPTATTIATAASGAGTYPITPGGGSASNYSFNYVNGILTVGKAVLTITANPAGSVYGAALVSGSSLTVSYSGFVNGDGPASLTTQPTVANMAAAGFPVGNYTLTPSGASDPNYTINYVSGNYTISPAPLTVTAVNQSMTYGGTVPVLTASYSGFVNGDDATSLSTPPNLTTTATSASAANTYPITVSGVVDPNYTITYKAGTMTVGKAVLTVTADNKTMPLGGPLPILTVSYSGFVNGENAASLTTQATATTSATATSGAGSYPITPTGGSSSNYSFSYVNGTLTVGKAVLTITAVNQSMTYGGTVPALTASYSGFVNGDGPASLTTPPTLTTTATSTSPAGAYPITASGAADPNYTILYNAGTMTVGKATLTITADSKAMPLGGPLPTLTISYSGFVNGDNASDLTTQPSLTVPASSSSPAGSYPITTSGAVDPNYTFIYVPGVLAVGKALLTISVNPAGSMYGAPLVPNSSLTVIYSGFVNGDGPSSLSQQPTITNTAYAGAPAGTYALVPSGAQGANYVINYVNGVYTISPAPLTVNAVNQTMTYGGSVPALTASYSGFVNGDNASSLTTPPTVTTTAGSSSPVGSYPITASGAVDPNYTMTYNPGVMTVQRATATVTANAASMTYGGAVPALSASYSGFVNGDNASVVTTPPTLSTTATSSSPVGTYPITGSGAVSQNYNFVYLTGTLTIGPAVLHVSANPQTKKYGAPDPDFTYTVGGYLNGDNNSIFTGSLSRTPGESVGSYPITIGDLSAGNNYTIDYTGSNLTITIGSQQITWVQSLIVGCNDTTLVQLTATASSGLPVSYAVSDTSVATVSGNTLTLLKPGTAVITATQAGDSDLAAAPAVTDTVSYQSASLIRQHWNDVIFFDNSSGDYVQWQWYKNGDAVPGATAPYYSETPSLNGQYYVIATNKDSQQVQSCILTIAAGAAIPGGIKVYPNPATPGATVTINCNYTSSALQGAVLQVIDLTGRVRQQLTTVAPSMQVVVPSETGTYILNLLLANGQKASVNVLVLPQ